MNTQVEVNEETMKRARQLGYAGASKFIVANSPTTKEASAEAKADTVRARVAAYGQRLSKRAAKMGQVYDAIVAPA